MAGQGIAWPANQQLHRAMVRDANREDRLLSKQALLSGVKQKDLHCARHYDLSSGYECKGKESGRPRYTS